MASRPKAVIFDLGGVLLKWNPEVVKIIPSNQLRTIMNSVTWHDLDRGEITLEAACEHFGRVLDVDAATIRSSLDEAQKSLTANQRLSELIQDLKASDPSLCFYVMSNISREHFDVVQKVDLPWSMFTSIFTSSALGMRKPDLCFFRHVIDRIGLDPSQIVMVDDRTDNICAARSLGIQGLLIDSTPAEIGQTLRNLLSDQISRAEVYMNVKSKNHFSVLEGQHDPLKDNFSQLLIWKLTGDDSLVQLGWPTTKPHAPTGTETDGLWSYFCEQGDPAAPDLPPDADTTSMAYLCIPESRRCDMADVNLVMDRIIANTNHDGLIQTYFDEGRPRVSPEVCCNVIRLFYRFGRGDDPGIKKTQDWVVQCLNTRACMYGSRFYPTAEPFLYFTACLYSECDSSYLKEQLATAISEALLERVNIPTNPLALALRISACQLMGLNPHIYEQDSIKLVALQEEDGGWPQGSFCCMGRTGAGVGNRGLTTALALKIMTNAAWKGNGTK